MVPSLWVAGLSNEEARRTQEFDYEAKMTKIMKFFQEFFFNAAQPGVGRVQVLGSKKFQRAEKIFWQWHQN